MIRTMDRRTFSRRFTAGAVALAAPTTVAGSRLVGNDRGLALHLVYETRLIDPIDAAEPLSVPASRLHAITGDVTPVWYNLFHQQWVSRSIRTAGITYEAEFFVMKTLARDYGYRVTHEQRIGEGVRWLLEPVFR
jgi:hypothetical protein